MKMLKNKVVGFVWLSMILRFVDGGNQVGSLGGWGLLSHFLTRFTGRSNMDLALAYHPFHEPKVL